MPYHIGCHFSSQVVDPDSDDDMSPKKRRDVLSRRPSYRKILNEIDEIAGLFFLSHLFAGFSVIPNTQLIGKLCAITGNPGHKVESSSECDSNLDSELSSHSLSAHYSTG